MHRGYNNINILLKRHSSNHNDKERYHNLEESIELDTMIEESLKLHNIEYHVVDVGNNTVKDIYKIINNI